MLQHRSFALQTRCSDARAAKKLTFEKPTPRRWSRSPCARILAQYNNVYHPVNGYPGRLPVGVHLYSEISDHPLVGLFFAAVAE